MIDRGARLFQRDFHQRFDLLGVHHVGAGRRRRPLRARRRRAPDCSRRVARRAPPSSGRPSASPHRRRRRSRASRRATRCSQSSRSRARRAPAARHHPSGARRRPERSRSGTGSLRGRGRSRRPELRRRHPGPPGWCPCTRGRSARARAGNRARHGRGRSGRRTTRDVAPGAGADHHPPNLVIHVRSCLEEQASWRTRCRLLAPAEKCSGFGGLWRGATSRFTIGTVRTCCTHHGRVRARASATWARIKDEAALRAAVMRPRELGESELARWRDFQSADLELQNPFLSPGFSRAVDTVSDRARVAVFEDGNTIVGFLPFELRTRGVATAIGRKVNNRQGFVHQPGLPWSWPRFWRRPTSTCWSSNDLVGSQSERSPFDGARGRADHRHRGGMGRVPRSREEEQEHQDDAVQGAQAPTRVRRRAVRVRAREGLRADPSARRRGSPSSTGAVVGPISSHGAASPSCSTCLLPTTKKVSKPSARH